MQIILMKYMKTYEKNHNCIDKNTEFVLKYKR